MKLVRIGIFRPMCPLKEEGAASIAGRSPEITDAKGLFAAAAHLSARQEINSGGWPYQGAGTPEIRRPFVARNARPPV